MTETQYKKLCELCSDSIDEISSMLSAIIPAAIIIMENHAPAAVKEHCKQIASINTNGMAEIMENLCVSGYLMIPPTRSFLTVFAVI